MTLTPKFCSECGGPLEPGARFCGGCGTPIPLSQDQKQATPPKNPSTPPPSPKKRRKKVVIPPARPPKQQQSQQPVQPQQEQQPKKSSPQRQSDQFVLKIRPLLSWSGAWGLSWLLLSVIHGLIYQHLFFMTGYGLPAITGGVIAALLIQITGVSQQGPTLKSAGIIAGSWFLFGGFLLIFRDILHFLHIPLHYFSRSDLLPIGGIIAAFLGWKVLKQKKTELTMTNLKSSQMMFLAGWALCGILPMFVRGWISVVVFATTVIAISAFMYKTR